MSLQDMLPSDVKDESKVLTEMEDLENILNELANCDKEVNKYRALIISLGQVSYKLYSPS